MKRLGLALLVGMLLLLCGCCIHSWEDATCTEPATCSKCEETEGESLGHEWEAADCERPETCAVCGETEGSALGHDWSESGCLDVIVCKRCEEEKAAPGHDWQDAICEEPKTCVVCGETEGKALGHDWQEANCTDAETCSRCEESRGEALGHEWIEPEMCGEKAVCAICEAKKYQPLDHTVETWAVIVEPTCVSTGLREGSCTRCGEAVTEDVESLPAELHWNEPIWVNHMVQLGVYNDGEDYWVEYTGKNMSFALLVGFIEGSLIFPGDRVSERIQTIMDRYDESWTSGGLEYYRMSGYGFEWTLYGSTEVPKIGIMVNKLDQFNTVCPWNIVEE